MDILFIRHGKTKGNEKKRYIGRTDEPLSESGKAQILTLKKQQLPIVERLYVSPMKRCLETAKLLYQTTPLQQVEALKECDFGLFEGKNYLELSDSYEYQQWIDSNGQMDFPEGESLHSFKKRSYQAFYQMVEEAQNMGLQSIGMIAHGGTIMSILERIVTPNREFYQWHVENGDGYFLKEVGKIQSKKRTSHSNQGDKERKSYTIEEKQIEKLSNFLKKRSGE